MFKSKFILFKSLAGNIINYFNSNKTGCEVGQLEKPKKSFEFSNLVRRILLFIFTGQWIWMMWVSERMYIKNGDIGDNWTKLLISIVGMMSVILGFYFSGQYSDRNSEEFKKIKEYDNDRMDVYNEEKKESEEDVEVTPKAILEEDEEDNA